MEPKPAPPLTTQSDLGAPAAGPTVVLPYVSALTRYGVSISGDDRVTRIHMPPAPLWRRLDFILVVLGTAFILFGVIVPAVAGMTAALPPSTGTFAKRGRLVGLLPYLLVLVALVYALRWYFKAKPVVFECDDKGLRILDLTPPTKKNIPSEIWMKRGSIYRIAYVPHAKAIMIRCQGHDLVEIPVRYSAMASEELAQILRETVGISNPRSQQLAKAD